MRLDYARPPAATEIASWKQAWLKSYPCDLHTALPYPRMALSGLLDRAATLFPDRAACTLYGKPTTFRQLNDQAHRLAAAFQRMGAAKGRHIGLLLPNIPEYLVALQATWLTGATALQLSPLMVAEEVGHWLEAADCRIVVTLDLLVPAVVRSLKNGHLDHLVVTSLAKRMAMWRGMLYRIERLRRNGYFNLPQDDHQHRFAELMKGPSLVEQVPVNPLEDVAVLAPTGGTTASPKAVMLTHHNLVANAIQLRNWLGGPDGAESILGVLPFFHAYGLSVSLLTSWAKGSTLHLHPRFETRAVLKIIQEQRPEIIPAVPAMLKALNGTMVKKPDLSFIRFVISGASALDAKVREEFEQTGVGQIVEGYGLTEASPVTHANPAGSANRPGTIGLPMPDTHARLINPDTGQEVPDGAVGELLVKGPQIMKGYFKNPDATAAVLQEGWLHTGDMARRDPEGYFTLVDRKKDIIKTSGFLVYPAEVEEVLRAYPGVAEAAVIGVPDADRGEMVKALVVPRTGSTLNMAGLEGHCKEHLGKHKRPREIEVVAELPKNFLGKVLRRKLREPAVSPV